MTVPMHTCPNCHRHLRDFRCTKDSPCPQCGWYVGKPLKVH